MRPDRFKELKQIATAGAATATGSKLSRKNELLRMLVIPSQWKVLAWSGVRGFISFLSPLYTIL